jgi:predicted RNA-binding protein with PUA-like domain
MVYMITVPWLWLSRHCNDGWHGIHDYFACHDIVKIVSIDYMMMYHRCYGNVRIVSMVYMITTIVIR